MITSFQDDDKWLFLDNAPVNFLDIHSWLVQPSCGAVVVFTGTVRDFSPGRSGVTHLEYEAYEEYVLASFRGVAQEVFERWPISRFVCGHRVGLLSTEETAVVVGTSSPHRKESFAAASFAIDTVKKEAPLWKKEIWPGGSEWIKGC